MPKKIVQIMTVALALLIVAELSFPFLFNNLIKTRLSSYEYAQAKLSIDSPRPYSYRFLTNDLSGNVKLNDFKIKQHSTAEKLTVNY